MGRRSTWTSKDDDQLRALAASGENSAAIAVRLNRTPAGIRKRAMDLGVKLAGSKRELGLKAKAKLKEPARHASLPWTQAEDDNLRKLALAGASSGEIGHQLNRTISSARSRARRLNIILKKDCD